MWRPSSRHPWEGMSSSRGGRSTCYTFSGKPFGCTFNEVYAQHGSVLETLIPRMYPGSDYDIGTTLRSIYSIPDGVVLILNNLSDTWLPASIYRMPNDTIRFQAVYPHQLRVGQVCADGSVYAEGKAGWSLYDVFTGMATPAQIDGKRYPNTGREREAMILSPSDSVPYWSASMDCGQTKVPFRIPGDSITKLSIGTSYQIAETVRGDIYASFDLGTSWHKVPPLPPIYASTGYSVKYRSILENDSTIVLYLEQSGTNMFIYSRLSEGVWRELPPSPFPVLSIVGGSSLTSFYMAGTPDPTISADSAQTTLALLDPTVGVAESVMNRPATTKRVVHRNDRLFFGDAIDWTLYAMDGSIVEHGHSADVTFSVTPGMYFLSKPGEQMMVAVMP